nr:MAG TPA: hypothetical protein [Caudoviricetes sp.]
MELNSDLKQRIAKDIVSRLLENEEPTRRSLTRYSISLYYGKNNELLVNYSDPNPLLEEVAYSPRGVVTLQVDNSKIQLKLSEHDKFDMYCKIKNKLDEFEIDMLSRILRSIESKTLIS